MRQIYWTNKTQLRMRKEKWRDMLLQIHHNNEERKRFIKHIINISLIDSELIDEKKRMDTLLLEFKLLLGSKLEVYGSYDLGSLINSKILKVTEKITSNNGYLVTIVAVSKPSGLTNL